RRHTRFSRDWSSDVCSSDLIQPFVALGLGLKAAGYRVRFATSPLFEDFVRSYGFEFAPVDDAINQLDSADTRAVMEGSKSKGFADRKSGEEGGAGGWARGRR